MQHVLRPYNDVNKAAFVVGILSLLSLVFGLIRSRLMVGVLGVGGDLDVFKASFVIPNILFAFGASLASITVLIPFLNERLHAEDNSIYKAKHFLSIVFTAFIVGMIVLIIVLMIIMPWLAPQIGIGFSSDQIDMLVKTGRIMLISPLLLGISNLFGSVTQIYKKFIVYALSPILYTIGIILGIIFLYPKFGLIGLSFGVLIGAFLHMLVHIPVLLQKGLIPEWAHAFDWRLVWSVIKLALPRALALSLVQITLGVFTSVATRVGDGALSIFDYALTFSAIPLAVVGVSYSVVAFPRLVELYESGEVQEFIKELIQPLQSIIEWSLPLIVVFVVFRAHFVRIVLGVDGFTWADTRLTAALMAIMVVAVAARGLTGLLVRGFYAAQKTWMPLYINITATVTTISLAYVGMALVKKYPDVWAMILEALRASHLVQNEILVLAIAFTIGAYFNSFLLLYFFKRIFQQYTIKLWGSKVRNSLIFSLILGLTCYGALNLFAPYIPLDNLLNVILHAAASGIVGLMLSLLIGIYFRIVPLNVREYLAKYKIR